MPEKILLYHIKIWTVNFLDTPNSWFLSYPPTSHGEKIEAGEDLLGCIVSNSLLWHCFNTCLEYLYAFHLLCFFVPAFFWHCQLTGTGSADSRKCDSWGRTFWWSLEVWEDLLGPESWRSMSSFLLSISIHYVSQRCDLLSEWITFECSPLTFLIQKDFNKFIQKVCY